MGFKNCFERAQVPTKKQLRFVVLKLKEPFGDGCINKNNSWSSSFHEHKSSPG